MAVQERISKEDLILIMYKEVAILTEKKDDKIAVCVHTEILVEVFLNYTQSLLQEFINKTNISIPKVELSRKSRDAMASYSAMKKTISIYYEAYQEFILMELDKGLPIEHIVSSINARMLFSILHETGHHIDLNKEEYAHVPFKVKVEKLRELAVGLDFFEIIENEEVQDILLSEAERSIQLEKSADEFAFNVIDIYFEKEFEELMKLGFKEQRDSSYRSYGVTKIAQLIRKAFDYLPVDDQKSIVLHHILEL